MPYGSADRSRVPKTVNSIGANLYSIDLSRGDAANPRLGISPNEGTSDTDRRAGYMTGVLPVIDRGEMFFQDNARIYAVNLESGLPLPGWSQTYDGNRLGRYTTTGTTPTPRGQLSTIAVTDTSVLAVMGTGDLRMMFGGAGRATQYTGCVSRSTHRRERWAARPAQLAESAPAAAMAAMRELDFSGSPLIVGDNVYVMGRGSKGMQFEDCYVFCIDLNTGKSKWATYVASANIAGLFFDDGFGSSQQGVSHLAYASGRVFCLTNLGAMAALNAYDGTIAWLNVYPREEQDLNGFRMGSTQRAGARANRGRSIPSSSPISACLSCPATERCCTYTTPAPAGRSAALARCCITIPPSSTKRRIPVREQINMIIGVVPGTSDLVMGTDRSVLRAIGRRSSR